MRNVAGKTKKIKSDFFRIVKTRRPTVALYERVISEDKFDILNVIEGLTNPRLREENGETAVISKESAYVGENSSLVMAPFCDHSPDYPSRFSDGTFGTFYCAKELECAVEETKFHTLKFLEATGETAYSSQRRVLMGAVNGVFIDITGCKLPEIYSTTDYSAGQEFGRSQKENGLDGIAFDSVRYKGGTCFAVFVPRAIKTIKELKCLEYTLNNGSIDVSAVSC